MIGLTGFQWQAIFNDAIIGLSGFQWQLWGRGLAYVNDSTLRCRGRLNTRTCHMSGLVLFVLDDGFPGPTLQRAP